MINQKGVTPRIRIGCGDPAGLIYGGPRERDSARLPARVLKERRFVRDISRIGRRRRGRCFTARSDFSPERLRGG